MTRTKSILSLLCIPLICALGSGCAAADDSADTEEFRMLPVAAITSDGQELLIGTFDQDTQEFVLTPSFVSAVEASAGGPLALAGAELSVPLATRTRWTTPIEVGDSLDLVVELGGELVIGGTLLIQPSDWTDTLTEAEAASSFTKCFDPIWPEWPEEQVA